jgi:hypothetical protein
MNWKKTILVVALAGVMLFVMSGCGQAEESTPTTGQPAPAPEGLMPAPPEGGVPEGMPAPPGGVALGERPPAPAMDLAAAAAKLGVTEQQLSEALGDPSQGPPDSAAAAEKLGISEDSLREALGLPEGVFPNGGPPPGEIPPAGSGPTGQEQ